MSHRIPHEENLQLVYLVQALVGAIGANFRAVSISFNGTKTDLHFVLASESESDREEIEDIASQFESFQHDHGNYTMGSVLVVVSNDPASANNLPGRMVFRMREPELAQPAVQADGHASRQ